MTIKKRILKKTVGDNIVGFKGTINKHIIDCRTGVSTCKFLIGIYICAMINKCFKKTYFQLGIIMTVKESRQLEFYENHYYKNDYDTFNSPEYLKSI